MKIKNPHKLFGEPVEGSLARFLEAKLQNQQASNPISQPATPPIPAAGIVNPENYIILEARSHGNYSYLDLLVAMDKTHQGKNWNQTHEALAQEGAFMLTIRQFVDFLNLLRTGKAFDGRGSLIDGRRIEGILDEIYKVGGSWRSEWLDAKFESKKGFVGIGSRMHINYEHVITNGQLFAQRSEELTDYLSSNKISGIDMGSWLGNANEHGLPKANVADGLIYYWAPVSSYVAWFYAVSGRAYLSCGRYPLFSNPSLGVRAARKKI